MNISLAVERPPLDPCRLVIGVSSSALFDLEEADKVYRNQNVDAYRQYQLDNEATPLQPGSAFPLVKKLQKLNQIVADHERDAMEIEVILLSRNSADTGLRVFNSIEEHDLGIRRAAFCSGDNPHRYIEAFGCSLFLSTEAADVRAVRDMGLAAARMLPHPTAEEGNSNEALRFAFDGDAVIFSDEGQRYFDREGKGEFRRREQRLANEPMEGGPFRDFLQALQRLQRTLGEESGEYLRTAIITARDAPAHKRMILTLRKWDIHVDEMLFLGGRDKGKFLSSFRADIFFDDQNENCASALLENIPAGQVLEAADHAGAD